MEIDSEQIICQNKTKRCRCESTFNQSNRRFKIFLLLVLCVYDIMYRLQKLESDVAGVAGWHKAAESQA